MPRFLHAFRSKDKDGEALSTGASSGSKFRSKQESSRFRNDTWVPPGSHRATGFLPEKALERIFHFVCPHSSDDKYKTPEESAGAIGDGCILCDTRDLASCMRVNRTWYRAAEKKLYRSVRFETVHYCEREDWLREHRKHKHKPEEVDQLRLRLLERTLGEFQTAAMTVQLLKFPYQIREGYKADLARIVTHTPNLRYVDLPEGIFSDQQSCMILKQQLMTRCPDLRFMKYKAGSEATFTRHSYEDLWYNLEAVSLEEMELEPDVLIYSLARMLNLNKLNLSNMTVLTDNLLQPSPSLPAMPPVRTLKIADAPSIGSNGLFAYVSRPDVAENLSTLQLENTALQMHDIHMLLGAAYRLRNFSFRAKVSHASQTSHIPPLASTSLRQIFFEISNEHTHTGTGSMPCDSYYEYLATSIASRTLPALRSVRTFCPHFPDLLVSLAPLISTPYAGMEANSPGLSPSIQKSPNSRPSNLPPRLSAMPGTLAPPPLVSPGLSPSMANRMSAMSWGSGSDPSSPGSVASHARSQSHIPTQHSGPRLSPGVAQRPSSSYGIGYSQTPFSPSLSELRHASAAEPPVPHDIVSRLGLVGGGLTIYTKPPNAEEMEWLVTELVPPSTGVGGHGATSGGIRGARPISLMPGAAGGPAQGPDLSWLSDGPSAQVSQKGLVGSHGGQLVGNGFGGYVEVKEEGKKGRRKGADWMG